MEKFGKILLLVLNICINVFLIGLFFLLLLWMIFDITPEHSLQKITTWLVSLTGNESQERTEQLSPKYRQRAHRNLYIQKPSKQDGSKESHISQPYKYE